MSQIQFSYPNLDNGKLTYNRTKHRRCLDLIEGPDSDVYIQWGYRAHVNVQNIYVNGDVTSAGIDKARSSLQSFNTELLKDFITFLNMIFSSPWFVFSLQLANSTTHME